MQPSRKLYIAVVALCALGWATIDLSIGHSRARPASRRLDATLSSAAAERAAPPSQRARETVAPQARAKPRVEAAGAAGASGSGAAETLEHGMQTPPSPEDPPDGEATRVEPDEVMFDYDNRPEQREWRGEFYAEQHDAVWTEQMNAQLRERAARALSGELRIAESSCRQTVCRLQLQFDDESDAEAFQKVEHERGVHYEFQSLDPFHSGEGRDGTGFSYELLVKRGELE